MKQILAHLVTLAIALLAAGECRSSEISSRTALIIGIGTYDRPEIPILEGVKEDMISAMAIAKAMDIPERNIRVLRDRQASKAGVLEALRQLSESTADGARTFVYYSGHGTRWLDEKAGGCVEGLLTYDYKVITNSEIAAVTKTLSDKADKFISIFDACHSAGVAPTLALTRAIGNGKFTPKYYMKTGGIANACNQPSNLITRSLLGEATRLGALPENSVQITSSLSTEVSFDEPGKGGLATQAVRDCLLGKATDLDASGAVSIAEVQQCAQQIVNQKLQNSVRATPHHVTVSGNRNLIPVQRPKPQTVSPAPQIIAAAPLMQTPAPPQDSMEPEPPTQLPPPTPIQPIPPEPTQEPSPPSASTPVSVVNALPHPAQPAPVKPPRPEPAVASIATLRDILQQRNPKRVINVGLNRAELKIGKDSLELNVKSSHDGYVYLIMLGSDAKSFYVLFPNGLDRDNRIHAKQALHLPRPAWQVKSAGPPGTDQLLIMVSDTPRNLDGMALAEPTATVPFTFALNTLGGRSTLIDFLTGSGATGKSESFGATLFRLKEVP